MKTWTKRDRLLWWLTANEIYLPTVEVPRPPVPDFGVIYGTVDSATYASVDGAVSGSVTYAGVD